MNRLRTKATVVLRGCLLGSREESALTFLSANQKKAKSNNPDYNAITHNANPTFTLSANFVKGLTR